MSPVTLKQIEAFVAIADLGGFRRAAEKLNTTQPNISSRLQGLEDQLQRKLMERDAGSIRLTEAGEALLPKARNVLEAMEDLLLTAQDDRLFQGRLRLGVTEMIVHSWLAEFLALMQTALPNMTIDLTVDLSSSLSDSLFNRSIDLTLQNAPFDQEATGHVELGAFPLIWVAAPVLCPKTANVSDTALLDHPILTYSHGSQPHQQLQTHFQQYPSSARLIPASNIAASLQMARKGLGVTCVPEAMIRDDLAQKSLIAFPHSWTPEPLHFAARFDAARATHAITKAAHHARRISEAFLRA